MGSRHCRRRRRRGAWGDRQEDQVRPTEVAQTLVDVRRSPSRLPALLLALCATSCAAPLMRLPSGPGTPARDAAAALDQATAVCRGIKTLTAEVSASGSIGGRRIRGRLLAGLAAPASVRIEAPAPFGQPIFIFVAQGNDATLYLPRHRRAVEHERPDAVPEAVAGVRAAPGALRLTLTGCAGRAHPSA